MPAAQRRPAHKTAHATCPFGQGNWSDCDLAASRQWGMCRAQTGDREPKPCTRWAMDADGWCGQHFASRVEAERKAKVEAARKAELNVRIDAYIAMTSVCPSMHVCPHDGIHPKTRLSSHAEGTRGLAAGGGLEPPTSRVTTGRSTAELPRKRVPFRLTELA